MGELSAPSASPDTRAVSRRALTKGIAWSVPTVVASVAAPAYAASCPPVSTTTPWKSPNYEYTFATAGTYTVPDPDGTGPGTGMTVKVSSVFGSNTQAGNQNVNHAGKTDNNLHGITASRGGMTDTLALHQSPKSDAAKTNTATEANSQTVTFTFSKPVTGLSFTIADIDSATSDFRDQVTVSGGVVVSTPTNSLYVESSGGTATSIGMNTRIDEASNAGNVKFTVSGTVTSITITYYNTTSASYPSIDGDQGVFISPLAFTYNPC